MSIRFSGSIAFGSLHDPLKHLSKRIHRALAHAEKMVWADDKGRIFAIGPGDQNANWPSFEAIGIFDERTPTHAIECALRLALRKRACNWITDWRDNPPSFNDYRMMPPTALGKRPKRVVRESPARAQAGVFAAEAATATVSLEKIHTSTTVISMPQPRMNVFNAFHAALTSPSKDRPKVEKLREQPASDRDSQQLQMKGLA